MWEKDDMAAKQIPDMTEWAQRILRLAEGLEEMLQQTAVSVLAGAYGKGDSAPFRAVPVSGFLTEWIASGGDLALPLSLTEGKSVMQEERCTGSSLRQGHSVGRGNRTPYETARELQKQSELLLRT